MNIEPLRKRATKSVGYLTVLFFFKSVIRLLSIVVLVRLLSPMDFGIISFAIVLSKGLQIFSTFGTEKYLIQRDTINNVLIGCAWSFNIFKGAAICLLIMVTAQYYATIIAEPHVKSVLYIIALSPLLEGMTNPGKSLAERDIKYGRISIFELVAISFQTILVIYLAYSFGDVRALAWGMVAASFFQLLLSFVFFRIPSLPGFHLDTIKELVSVGKHFFIIAIGGFIITQADNMIVGMVMGPSILGIYAVAYRLMEFPLEFMRQIINRVSFPVYSRLQTEKNTLSGAIDNVLQIQLAIFIPCILVLFILAKPIILTVYGEKWLDAIPILQALALVLLGRGLSHLALPYIIGTGNFRFASRVKVIETTVFIIFVFPGTYYFGAVGTAIGAGIGYFVAACVRIVFLCNHSGITLMRFAKQIIRSIISMVPGTLISLFILVKYDFASLIQLIISFGLLAVMYIISSLIFQRELVYSIRKLT